MTSRVTAHTLSRDVLARQATAEDIRIMRDAMGLNDPLYVQYGRFLLGILRADHGNSFWLPQPAVGLILERLPATLALAGLVLSVVSVVVGVGLGVLSATRPYSLLDRLATIFAVGGQSLPLFWLGLMLKPTSGAAAGNGVAATAGAERELIVTIQSQIQTLDNQMHTVRM